MCEARAQWRFRRSHSASAHVGGWFLCAQQRLYFYRFVCCWIYIHILIYCIIWICFQKYKQVAHTFKIYYMCGTDRGRRREKMRTTTYTQWVYIRFNNLNSNQNEKYIKDANGGGIWIERRRRAYNKWWRFQIDIFRS